MSAALPVERFALLAADCPESAGVYRLYCGTRLVHIGMAAGSATLRSEILAHGRGDYGPRTQGADRVEWEVVADALFAYRRFRSLHSALTYVADAPDGNAEDPVSASGRYSRPR